MKLAKKTTTGVPGKLQCAVEMAVEWIDGVVRENYHGKRGVIAPLAFNYLRLGVYNECD